jgi:MerR family transcriptional regulator, light-induced transcriptional regulator
MKTLLYPIRAVSKLTGISLDTLRAWERRYQVVTPQRDDRGRLYTEADVERLRLLNNAVERGHSIGRLAGLEDEDLRDLLADAGVAVKDKIAAVPQPVDRSAKVPRGVIGAIRALDYAAAERELGLIAAVLTPRELVHSVALPLMNEIGEEWHAGRLSVAQEHMASSLLRNLMGSLIPLYRRTSTAGKLLFATTSGEHHEFGILLSAMLAVGGGLGIIYLGADLPAEEIVAAAQKTAPQAVVLGFVGANGAKLGIGDLRHVADRLPSQIELWIGGTRNESLIEQVKQTRALLIEDFEMLEQHLTRLGARF